MKKNKKIYKVSRATRKKMSLAGKGRVFSAEHRAALSAALTGKKRKYSEEQKASISRKLRRAAKRRDPASYPGRPSGVPHTAEAIAKMSATHKANWRRIRRILKAAQKRAA